MASASTPIRNSSGAIIGWDTGTVSYQANPSNPYSISRPSSGQTLGASTSSSGGGGGSSSGGSAPSGGDNGGGGGGGYDPTAAIRAGIESSYNDYFNQLDQVMNTMPGQAESQNQIAQNSYQQGVNTLTNQKESGMTDLAATERKTMSNQNKNLTNLAENLRNLFRTGQVYLGARGAGDSSAANQYSYGLAKMGNKSRGDIMTNTADIVSQIDDRRFKLGQTYNTEMNNIKLTLDTKKQEIAQWLAEAQNQIRQMKAEGSLNKGRDLASLSTQALNFAMQQLAQAQATATNRRGMLEQWAMNNSTNINQLAQNMKGIAAYAPTMPQYQGMNGLPSSAGGAGTSPTMWSTGNTEDMFKQKP